MTTRRPSRNPGESPVDYLARLAATQGFLTRTAAARALGVSGRPTAPELARILGEEEASVAFDTPMASPSGVHVRGETLYLRQWSKQSPRRFCPLCLKKDEAGGLSPWQRVWWWSAPTVSCPVHSTRLVAQCSCGAAVRGGHLVQANCLECGRKLSETPVPACRSAFDAYVVGRLGGSGRTRVSVLDGVALGEAIAAMAAIAREHPMRAFADNPLDPGLRAFEDFPSSFLRELDAVAGASGKRGGRWGAAKAYGSLVTAVARMDGPLGEALADGLVAHARNGGIIGSGKTLFGEAAPKNRTLASASRILGVSSERVKRILKVEGIDISPGKGMPASIDPDAVLRASEARRDAVDLETARRMLRIGKSQARDFIDRGLLAASARPGPGGATYAVKLSAIDDLIRRLTTRCAPPDAAARRVGSVCRDMQVPIATAVNAILEGQTPAFRSADPSARGLEAICVRPGDLSLLRTKRDAMTLQDAAEALGVKWEAARALLHLGLIGWTDGGKVCPRSVAAFTASHVKATTLAEERRTSSRSLIATLASQGIKPVAGPPSCRQTFFRAADVDRTSFRDRP